MRAPRAALILLFGLLAASPHLSGNGLPGANPLPVHHPPHVPLQYVEPVPVPGIQFPQRYVWHASPFMFGRRWVMPVARPPIVRERVIIRDRGPARKRCRHRIPIIDFWIVVPKDGPLRAVTEYWLQDEIFHYVERDGTKSSMPLNEIDLSLTKRVNLRFSKPFRLPRSDP